MPHRDSGENLFFFTFGAILPYFRHIFGSENYTLKMQICTKDELGSRRFAQKVNYAFNLNFEGENIFFDQILWYSATSW